MVDDDNQVDLPQLQPQDSPVGSGLTPLSGQEDAAFHLGQTAVPVGSAVPTLVDLPDEASDIDLIEKEWVDKAKQIVGHTSDDPYTKQAEISKMKADYMKKRYNKDVNIAED